MRHNKAILVTGGAGFIGSHACKYLAARGYYPVTVDNLSTGHQDAVRWGPFVNADIADVDVIARTLREYRINTVLHFAASAYVGESVSDPLHYYRNNVGGMTALLEACQRTKVKRFVLSSSCATYGIPASLPISEETTQNPINPYGRTKLFCEQMLEDSHTAFGLSYVILRYFNACGADPTGELSERHDPETHLIPLALQSASGQRDCLNIFGSDYDTPDGTCVRDYIHVQDLARAHLLALQYIETGNANTSFNIGSGRGYSINEIVTAIEQLGWGRVNKNYLPRRPGDPAVLFTDTTRARTLLKFTADCSDIETILRDAAPNFGLEVKNDSVA